jgi:serine phosphatase RsbU (regulator of sigma subunit)/FixJ family two-component response regulator/anti-sigma regulatory factor (Ser/Thr protein kinase)
VATTLKGPHAPQAGEQPLAIPEPPRRSRPQERPPASILLVDDDESSLRALHHVLEPLGQNLVGARSGEEALRWLLREEFALILLDMRMPGLDGVQTARYINARARTRQIPIIFLTAHGRDVERLAGAHAAGAVDYVPKPFEPDVLRSKVSVFVELHHARTEHVHEARARAEAEGIASTVSKLQRISDAALAHLELGDLLPEIVRRAGAVFGADAAGLLLGAGHDAELTLLTREGVQRVVDRSQLARLQEMLAPALHGRPINLAELPAHAGLPAALRAMEPRSLIAAPLSGARGPLGALLLAAREPHRFSDEDLVVLNLGSERAAVAVEHALSYERERALVERLQDHLLPDSLPVIPGLAMAARYRPSERLAQVGGDWYDAIPFLDGSVGLVIGDVVGHGIAAAALMAELRSALRAYAITDPGSPARALSSLNTLVVATHGRMVATLLYMHVDADGTRVRFCSAGHPPPLVLDAEGRTRFLEHRPAPPLGVSALTGYEDCAGELEPGGTLLLYTDGLVERRGEVIDYGLERLERSLQDAPAELEALCAHVLAAADDGGGFGDDTALVALRRLARSSEVLDLTLPAEPHSVPTARLRLRSWLSEGGASAEEILDITIAANEACTNAVEHAYGPARGATFRLLAKRSQEALELRVSDAGAWRQPRGTGRGRGIGVIGELMDELEIDRTPTGTTVAMTKRWQKHGER